MSELSPPLDEEVPWQRVVNARGEISPRGDPGSCRRQADKLREEGIEVRYVGGDALRDDFEGALDGQISMANYGWFPPVDDESE